MRNIRWIGNAFSILLVVFSFYQCKKNGLNRFSKVKVHQEHELAFPNFSEEDFLELGKYKVSEYNKELVNNFYQYFWEGNDLWGEFLVAQGNQIIIHKSRGFANYADSIPITDSTPIHLASISKNLTAMLILKLCEKNKLQLNQKVNTILKKFPYDDITVFDLLTHRSGLGQYTFYAEEFGWIDDGKDFTNKEMYKMFVECAPALLFKPNTYHSYCNTNYAFLALIIEEITAMPYPEAMQELVFKPLNMKHSYVFQKKDFSTATLSYYYNKKAWNWDDYDLIYGDKNIYSTAMDLFNYSRAMFSDKFMRKSLLDSAMSGYSYEKPGVKNYGLGFRLKEFDNGKKTIYHTGKWHGNMTTWIHQPDEELTIIALGNRRNKSIYSAITISSLFGDYPFEVEADEMDPSDSMKVVADSLQKSFNDIMDRRKDSINKKIEKSKKENQKKNIPIRDSTQDKKMAEATIRKDSLLHKNSEN